MSTVTVNYKMGFAEAGLLTRALESYIETMETVAKGKSGREHRDMLQEIAKAKDLLIKMKA